jgi:hypothetical protein
MVEKLHNNKYSLKTNHTTKIIHLSNLTTVKQLRRRPKYKLPRPNMSSVTSIKLPRYNISIRLN